MPQSITEQVAAKIAEGVAAGVKIDEIDDTIINTPFLDIYNDMVQLHVAERAGKTVLHDGGDCRTRLFERDTDYGNPAVVRLVGRFKPVYVEDDRLSVDYDGNTYGVCKLLAAIIAVDHMDEALK